MLRPLAGLRQCVFQTPDNVAQVWFFWNSSNYLVNISCTSAICTAMVLILSRLILLKDQVR